AGHAGESGGPDGGRPPRVFPVASARRGSRSAPGGARSRLIVPEAGETPAAVPSGGFSCGVAPPAKTVTWGGVCPLHAQRRQFGGEGALLRTISTRKTRGRIMQRILPVTTVVIVLLSAGCSSKAPDKNLKWQTFNDPEGAFSVEMPGAPESRDMSMANATGVG